MKLSTSRKMFGIALMALLIVVSATVDAMGQGRGRRAGRNDRFDRKCEKFVNCHDARDGRWDGRGPDRDFDRRNRFRRNRRFRDRDSDTRWRRRRDRDRDFDRVWWRR